MVPNEKNVFKSKFKEHAQNLQQSIGDRNAVGYVSSLCWIYNHIKQMKDLPIKKDEVSIICAGQKELIAYDDYCKSVKYAMESLTKMIPDLKLGEWQNGIKESSEQIESYFKAHIELLTPKVLTLMNLYEFEYEAWIG